MTRMVAITTRYFLFAHNWAHLVFFFVFITQMSSSVSSACVSSGCSPNDDTGHLQVVNHENTHIVTHGEEIEHHQEANKRQRPLTNLRG